MLLLLILSRLLLLLLLLLVVAVLVPLEVVLEGGRPLDLAEDAQPVRGLPRAHLHVLVLAGGRVAGRPVRQGASTSGWA